MGKKSEAKKVRKAVRKLEHWIPIWKDQSEYWEKALGNLKTIKRYLKKFKVYKRDEEI